MGVETMQLVVKILWQELDRNTWTHIAKGNQSATIHITKFGCKPVSAMSDENEGDQLATY